MSAPNFRFGKWTIAPANNTVSIEGRHRRLDPRAMEVLQCLCRKPGMVHSTEQLLRECWGSSDHDENQLHKIIAQLRRVLGDSRVAPLYIETIRKRGYRTVAAVLFHEDSLRGSWGLGPPFRGLEPFQAHHAAIYCGRRRAVEQLLRTIALQVRAACAMVLVLGSSGAGKTSLVCAGVLPRCQAGGDSPVPGSAIECVLFMHGTDVAAAGLFSALGGVLLDSQLDGSAVFPGESAHSLGQRLCHDTGSVLADLRRRCATIRLCLFIDQFEALLQAQPADPALCRHFIDVLDRLARSGAILLILACRNECAPQLAHFPALASLKLRGGHFDLRPPTGAEIAQMIRRPACAAGLTFGSDPASGERLDDLLCDASARNPDTLPLLQYCLLELYRLRAVSGELSFAVFQDWGGVDGAIGARAERLVGALDVAQRAVLPRVFAHLLSVADDTLTIGARRVPWAALSTPLEHGLVRALVEARLFVSGLEGGAPVFGIAHDALLRCWPQLVAWIRNHCAQVQLRTRIRWQAARWHASRRARDLLLPRGIQVREADALLAMPDFCFSGDERDYVRASLRKARRGCACSRPR